MDCNKFHLSPPNLSEVGKESSIYHAFAAPFKHAGIERGTSSIIKGGQKDTEASISVIFPRNLIQSVSWSLAEFRHNKIVQSPHENYFNVCRQHKEK